MTDTTETTTSPKTQATERERIERYDPASIESRWQKKWDELGLYRTDLHEEGRPPYYLLTMYPYPSGDIHIGHWYIITPTDAIARFLRMHGENVFLPIGFDAFGLPAENAAIKNNINPRTWTMSNIDNMRRQLRTMGATFDWESEVVTADPDYYRWNQWFFLQFLKAGLAYRQTSAVDWCPNDGTLAREQVEGADRHCWRCGAKVEKRDLAQWYLKVTNYADELIDFSGLEWPDAIKAQQTNWVGRSEGAELVFTIAPNDHQPGGDELRVFTTRPDTLFGATFMVLAPEHPLVATLTSPERKAEVDAYVARTQTETEIERLSTDREKTGVAIGADAINPINGERIPIWIADYVLAGYGTGAIMAVPAHDERDFAFARAFGLADPPGCRATRRRRGLGARRRLPRPRRRRGPRQFGPVRRDAGRRGRPGDRRQAGRGAQGQADGHVSAPRLVDQSPALLGHADPGHLLRSRRDRAGPGGGAAGPPPGHRRLPRQRREPAGSRRGVPQRHLSEMRWARPSRDRHDGHVHRLVLVLVSLPVTGEERRRRSTAPSSSDGRRSGSTPAARSTRSCTSSMPASSPR